MCLFTLPGPGIVVSDTTIFARKAGADSQILAYQMTLRADQELAMVLPLPVGSRDEARAVEFISLENCPDFFERLAEKLPVWQTMGLDIATLDLESAPAIEMPVLEVHKVGAYEASFVPSIGDFGRLDRRFRLPPEVWASLSGYLDWGFAVFKLKNFTQESKPAHAMALRFVTGSPDKLFFPTIHVHDGQVHPLAQFDHQLYFQSNGDVRMEYKAFDNGEVKSGDEGRLIRMQHFGSKEELNWDHPKSERKGLLRWSRKSGQFFPDQRELDCANGVLEPGSKFHAFGLRNTIPNRDTWFDLTSGSVIGLY